MFRSPVTREEFETINHNTVRGTRLRLFQKATHPQEGEYLLLYFAHSWHYWLVQFKNIVITLFASTILLIVKIVLLTTINIFWLDVILYALIGILAITLLILFLKEYINYREDATYVTNKNVVFVDKNIFGQKVKKVPINEIIGLSANQKGVWRQLFNFGDLEITTDAEKSLLILHTIHDVKHRSEILSQFMHWSREKEASTSANVGNERLRHTPPHQPSV